MKNIAKKIVIYSMVGLLQIGLGASVIEASPRHDDKDHQRYEQRKEHNRRIEEEKRRQEREWRIQEENRRHEEAMRRHHHESEREWHERQERERERHENTVHEIEAGMLGILVGMMIK